MKHGGSQPGGRSRSETLTSPTGFVGVEGPVERLLDSFIHEIDVHCAWAEIAYTSLVMSLNDRDVHGFRGPSQHQRIFFYLHAFLTHTATISTMLWPSDQVQGKDLERVGLELAEHLLPVRHERGRRLRKALGIKKSSLLMDERLRDFLAHYDARVELWGMSAQAVQDMVISPVDANDSTASCQATRHFDPITMVFTYQCEQFDLPAFARELTRLHRSIAKRTFT